MKEQKMIAGTLTREQNIINGYLAEGWTVVPNTFKLSSTSQITNVAVILEKDIKDD